MRDLDTIGTAIMAAETGHLVLSTLHTTDAAQTVDRIIDVFPQGQQQQIRLQVSQVIEAVLSQALLPSKGGKGRVAAFEIMIANAAVRNLIRDERTFELQNVMQLCSSEGMRTFDEALANLVKAGLVSVENALMKSSNQPQLKGKLGLRLKPSLE
jgi:twitching motility protein PilT